MSTQKLRKYLHDAAQKLSGKASQEPETITEEQLTQLERLARLVELCDKSRPKIKPKRWPTIVILASTSLIISVLLFFRVPSTEIELELTSTEIQFSLSKQAILTDAMVLSSLGVSELQDIQLPRSRGQTSRTFFTDANQGIGAALRLSAINTGNTQGTLTLTALLLPEGTLIRISRTDVSNQYRLFLELPQNASITLQVSVKGSIRISPSGAPAEEYLFSIPSSIQMRPATNQMTFDLTLADGAQATFSPDLPAKDFAFARVDEFMGSPARFVRRVSTITSGTLYLAELNSREYTLRTGEGLQFKASNGSIHQLRLTQDEIFLLMHGKMQGMTRGWEENQKNLMPNYLEWVVARPGLMLFWSQTISFFLLLLGIWRWWRKTE